MDSRINYFKENYSIIFHYTGIILIITAIALLFPLLLIPFYPTNNREIFIFIGLSSITSILGYTLKNKNKFIINKELSLQDSGIVIILSWSISILIGALPFILTKQLNFSQAIFEAVSGFTTTGLSVVDVTKTSHMMLLWRSIMQFLGGIGLTVIMLSTITTATGVTLYNAEGRNDKLFPNLKISAKLIVIIYCSYIIIGTILYLLCGISFFDAINHSIAAVSTGGFSTKSTSIGYYNSSSVEIVTIILMILGTINFHTHSILWKRNFKLFFKIDELKFMWFLLFISIPFLFFITINPLFPELTKSIRVSIFEIVSALSTSGFSTVSYSNWNSFGIFTLIILMIIGGGTGSTAGGIKQLRIFLLIKLIYWNIKEMFISKKSIRYNYIQKPEGKVIVDNYIIKELLLILAIYLIFFILSVFIFLAYGYDIKSSMFEIASCLSTVGLSYGITSPTTPNFILWIMSIDMFLGRLEFFIIFYSIAKLYNDFKYCIKKVRD